MRYLQRLRDFHSHLEQLIERHRTFMQPLGQRLSTQVLHHQEISSILRTDVIEMTDVSMVQGGNGAPFTLEVPFELGIVRKMSRQDLARDGAIEARVPGTIDLAHPAGAERGADFIGAELGSCGGGHWRAQS